MVAIIDGRGMFTDGPPWSSKSRQLSNFVQFAEGHYKVSNLNQRIICPRQESEPWARCKLTLPGVPWQIPVEVTGLARPVHYSVTGPAGMYFVENFPVYDEVTGEYISGKENSYLRWDNPVEGSYEYTVTCRGQEGSVLTETLTLVVSTSGILVVTPEDNLNDIFSSGYGDYQIWLREGEYAPTASLNINGAGNPKGLIGYPGEVVNIDMTDSLFVMDNGNDICVTNINFKNSNPTLTQSRIIYGTTNWVNGNRFLCYDVSFDNVNVGTEGGDNPGPLTILAPAALRSDGVVRNIYLSNITNGTDSSALGSWYQIQNWVCRGIVLGENCNATRGVFLKSSCVNVAVHEVESLINNFASGAVVTGLGSSDGISNDLLEVAYCRLDNDANSDSYAIRTQQSSTDVGTPRVYIFRNNIRGRIGNGGSALINSTVYFENNILESQFASPVSDSNGNVTMVVQENSIGNYASNFLDNEMNIDIGAEEYFGLRGVHYG